MKNKGVSSKQAYHLLCLIRRNSLNLGGKEKFAVIKHLEKMAKPYIEKHVSHEEVQLGELSKQISYLAGIVQNVRTNLEQKNGKVKTHE